MIRGSNLRMQKLLRNKRAVFLALDHGFSMGPIPGLEDLSTTARELACCDVDAIILHRGAIKNLSSETFKENSPPIIIHLAGSDISSGVNKFVTADPYQALLFGADAVSFQINIGTSTEETQIKEAARLIERADGLEMPVLLMIYDKRKELDSREKILKSVRLGIELGADMLKIDTQGNLEALQEAVKYSPVPIFIAGGEKEANEAKFIDKIKESLDCGARGISVGRNVFQSPNPAKTLEKICDFTHNYEK